MQVLYQYLVHSVLQTAVESELLPGFSLSPRQSASTSLSRYVSSVRLTFHSFFVPLMLQKLASAPTLNLEAIAKGWGWAVVRERNQLDWKGNFLGYFGVVGELFPGTLLCNADLLVSGLARNGRATSDVPSSSGQSGMQYFCATPSCPL